MQPSRRGWQAIIECERSTCISVIRIDGETVRAPKQVMQYSRLALRRQTGLLLCKRGELVPADAAAAVVGWLVERVNAGSSIIGNEVRDLAHHQRGREACVRVTAGEKGIL